MLLKEALVLLNLKGQNPIISRRLTKIRAFVILFVEIAVELSIILSFFMGSPGTYTLIDSITYVRISTEAIMKDVVLLAHENKFAELINYLKELWPTNKFGPKAERRVSNIQSRIGILLRGFRHVISLCTLIYLARPFYENKKTLPTSWLDFCEIENNIYCYIATYTAQSVVFIFNLFSVTGFDFLVFVLLTYAYCEMEQIKCAFLNLEIDETVDGDETRTLSQMVSLVKQHNLVLGFINELNNLVSIVLFCQFSASVGSMVTGLLLITIEGFPPTPASVARNAPYLLCALTQTFIWCMAGEKITNQAISIADVAYESNWSIKHQPKLTMAICLVIERSQKLTQITAGSIWNLNMSMFASILKGIMSFLTFMQTVYGPK